MGADLSKGCLAVAIVTACVGCAKPSESSSGARPQPMSPVPSREKAVVPLEARVITEDVPDAVDGPGDASPKQVLRGSFELASPVENLRPEDLTFSVLSRDSGGRTPLTWTTEGSPIMAYDIQVQPPPTGGSNRLTYRWWTYYKHPELRGQVLQVNLGSERGKLGKATHNIP